MYLKDDIKGDVQTDKLSENKKSVQNGLGVHRGAAEASSSSSGGSRAYESDLARGMSVACAMYVYLTHDIVSVDVYKLILRSNISKK